MISQFTHAAALTLGLAVVSGTGAAAQSLLLEPRVVNAQPTWSRWSFSEGLLSETSTINTVTQLSLPFAASFSPSRDWRIGLSGGYTTGSVQLGDEGAEDLSLSGVTDVKIRTVGRLMGERLWLTLGVNLPTGLSRLSEQEAAAVRVLGAPALRGPTPALGSGVGVIAGPVVTGRVGGWSVGAGVSFELRGSYTPLEAALAGGPGMVTELSPAGALHFSIGFDRLVGSGKMSVVLSSDRYGTDIVTVATGQADGVSADVQLGPAFGARWSYRTATQRLRDLRLDASARWRTDFSRQGVTVEGSAGSYLDAAVTTVLGRAGGIGWTMTAALSRDSGLDVDNSLATAAASQASVSVGPELRVARHFLQPTLRIGIASVDTGAGSRSGSLFGLGLSWRTDW